MMTRPIMLAGFVLFAATWSGSVEAQQAGNMGEQFAKEGKEQVTRSKQYRTVPRSQAYMSAPRPRQNYGTDDVSGRLDMSGRVPPAYFKLRDQSSPVSRRGYFPRTPRRPAPSSHYYSNSTAVPSPSVDRFSTRGPIPPAPR